ncbi:MAG: PAS domain S-box protein [Kiritimatiellae bacterium]|nr:PAS domain S-box protein [Kiritimatiellia bacterium]
MKTKSHNQLEQALRKNEELLRVVFQNTPLTVATLDHDLRYTWVYNARHGFKPEDIVGKRADELIPASAAAETIALQRRVLESGVAERCDIRGCTRGIEWVYDTTADPVRNDRGEIVGLTYIVIDITERRQTEDALKKTRDELEELVQKRTQELHASLEAQNVERQRFINVLDALPAYVILLTPDYQVSFANRFFREIFGEARGRRCFDFLFGRSEPCENCETYTVLKTMKPHEWEWTGPNGRTYFIRDFPFTDTDGATLVLEMGVDVTEHKKVEAELDKYRLHLEKLVRQRTGQLEAANTQLQAEIIERKRMEETLRYAGEQRRLVLEAANMGAWDYNLQIGSVFWDERCQSIFGVAAGDKLEYSKVIEIMHPADRRRIDQAVQQAIDPASPGTYDTEYRVVWPNGTIHWVMAKGQVYFAGTGAQRRAERFIGISMDITERKKMEATLRESQADLNRAQAIAHIGSWRLDLRRNTLLWSDESHRIFGIPRDRPMTYEMFLAAVHPEDRAFVDRSWQAALLGEPYDIEHRILAEGAVKWVRERAELEIDKDGVLLGGFGTTQDITELREAREREVKALSEATAAKTAREIITAMDESVLLLDMNGIITFINPAMEQLIGVKCADVNGRLVADFLPGWLSTDGRPAAIATLQALLAGNQPDLKQFEIHANDGHIVPILPSAAFSRDPDGRPVAIVMTLHDISDLTQTQQALQISAQKYRELVENANSIIMRRTVDGQVTFFNEYSQKFFGYSENEIRGRNVIGTIVPRTDSSGNDMAALIRAIGQNPEAYAINENENICRDSRRVWIQWTNKALRNKAGEVEEILCIGIDVTERKKAADALRLASVHTRSLIEASLDPLVNIGPDGKITDVNAATEAATGCSRKELIGTDFLDYFTEPEKARFGYQRAFREGFVRDYPLEIRHRSGDITPVLYNATVYRDKTGHVVGVFAAARDITGIKKAEKEKTDYQKRLRSLANKLATTEEQERRRISRQIHDTVVQSLSLSAIKLDSVTRAVGSKALLDEQACLTPIRKLLDEAITQCRLLMADLTPPMLYELGLMPALDDLVDKFRKQHGMDIRLNGVGTPGPMQNVLRGLLFQSTRELIVNALKYAGPCRIDITVRREDSFIHICVKDNGAGFDPERRRSHESGIKGGFGLFNIRERVEGLGGSFDIHSEKGRGTTASIKVPLPAGQQDPEPGNSG